jgi:hypothetical protein
MKDALIRLIKVIDIGYITLIYFAIAFLVVSALNEFYGEFNAEQENKKPVYQIVLEIVGMLWINGILIYTVRNLVAYVPFPLDNYYGFQHSKVKELSTAAIFVYFLMFLQTHLQAKIRNLYSIYNGRKTSVPTKNQQERNTVKL